MINKKLNIGKNINLQQIFSVGKICGNGGINQDAGNFFTFWLVMFFFNRREVIYSIFTIRSQKIRGKGNKRPKYCINQMGIHMGIHI
jgi:hypothetical protein